MLLSSLGCTTLYLLVQGPMGLSLGVSQVFLLFGPTWSLLSLLPEIFMGRQQHCICLLWAR